MSATPTPSQDRRIFALIAAGLVLALIVAAVAGLCLRVFLATSGLGG